MVALDTPRGLSAEERALIDFLLSGPLGDDQLRAQAASARVVTRCSCGCPTVGLTVDTALPESVRQADWIGITARQRTSIAGQILVALHVVDGRLERLEVWAGRYGSSPEIEIDRLRHL
jgi:hypothetical protein